MVSILKLSLVSILSKKKKDRFFVEVTMHIKFIWNPFVYVTLHFFNNMAVKNMSSVVSKWSLQDEQIGDSITLILN